MMLVNWTGSSHPPKSIILPPSSCSTALRGVFLSDSFASGRYANMVRGRLVAGLLGCWVAEFRATDQATEQPSNPATGGGSGVKNEIGDFLDYLSYERNVSINTVGAYRNDLESFTTFLCNDYLTMARDLIDLRRVDHLTIRAYLAHL